MAESSYPSIMMTPLSCLVWIYSCLALPTWSDLDAKLPPALPPVYNDELPEDCDVRNGLRVPVFYRDRDGLCPYSEQVWLALEAKGVDYVTVLVEGDSDGSSTPRLQWPDGTVQEGRGGEVFDGSVLLELIERIEREYSDRPPDLFPAISKAVDSVRCNIVRFRGVFPRGTLRTVHAPFLFRAETEELVPVSDHMVTLEETDEVLEEYFTGPLLCGEDLTAADVVWAPFLERYAAQLPLVYDGEVLEPRSFAYEAIKEWFEAMEQAVPSYACRVMGDKISWERTLREAVEHGDVPRVDLLPPRGSRIPTNRRSFDGGVVWKRYAEDKPWLASTPSNECVAYIVRNRNEIASEAAVACRRGADEVDSALREVVGALASGGGAEAAKGLSGNARAVMAFLDDRLRAPRDMGALPISALRTLAAKAPKPRINA